MAYGIFRVEKVKSGSISGKLKHNYRESQPKNADKKREQLNKYSYSKTPEEVLRRIEIAVENQEKMTNKKLRKDAVKVLEILVAHSPEKSPGDGYFEDAEKFIFDRYGKENVVSKSHHMDEKTPHTHYMVLPRIDGKFNAREVVGDRKKMSKLQDSFYTNVSKKYDLQIGTKGTNRRHIPISQLRAGTAMDDIEEAIDKKTRAVYAGHKLKKENEVLKKENELLKKKRKTLLIELATGSVEEVEKLRKEVIGITRAKGWTSASEKTPEKKTPEKKDVDRDDWGR